MQATDVGLHGVGEIGKIEGQQVGVGEAHHGRAGDLGKRAAVGKVGVAEVRVPVKIVVDRVIDATVVFAAEAEIQHGNTEKILETGVIGAAARNVDAQVGPLSGVPGGLRRNQLG